MATHSSILAWRIPDRGAWWATVHGVAKSWRRLSDQHKYNQALEASRGMTVSQADHVPSPLPECGKTNTDRIFQQFKTASVTGTAKVRDSRRNCSRGFSLGGRLEEAHLSWYLKDEGRWQKPISDGGDSP